MTAIYDRADSLWKMLTGASTDGGSQTDPALSLGNYASSTRVAGLVVSVTSPISGITVTYASPENATGTGTLTATSSTTLAYTAPGGSQGPSVSIAAGQSYVLEDGSDPGAYITISSSTASVTGTASLALSLPLNTAISMTDAAPAETTAGSVRYRAIMAVNKSAASINNLSYWIGQIGTQQVSAAGQLGASGAGTISLSSGSFATWPSSGFCHIQTSGGSTREIVYYSSRTDLTLTIPAAGRGLLGTSAAAGAGTDNLYSVPGLRIAKEEPTANALQTIASDTTAPTGLTWNAGITAATGLSIGTLASGDGYGIWIERTIVAGSQAIALAQFTLRHQFDGA